MADSDSDSMDDCMMFSLCDVSDADADDEDAGGDSKMAPAQDSSGSGDESSSVSKRKAELPKETFKPITLRERRRSKLGLGGEFSRLKTSHSSPALYRLQSVDSGFDEDPVHINNVNNNLKPGGSIKSTDSPKVKWLKAVQQIKLLKDPWEDLGITNLKTERCTRHRYNALKKAWKVDEVWVKMEKDSFNHGAMRSCFRLKKLPSSKRRNVWSKAHNYVAKIYMEDVDRAVYYEDVRLQMDAKLWGEEYNRHNPPKKVDIFQMCVLEFSDRENVPLYHLEHFIEGEYIKYNSNSGFVDESLRFTPQAFSHFTFERSGHSLVVVDVQGVGDLWTDPQIHTEDGGDYGDGNLGPKGMALFFHSHVCNVICNSLNLGKFDLAPSEIASQGHFRRLNERRHTMIKGTEQAVYSASPSDKTDLLSFLARSSTSSHRHRTSSALSDIASECSEVESLRRKPSNLNMASMIIEEDEEEEEQPESPSGSYTAPIPMMNGRHNHNRNYDDDDHHHIRDDMFSRFTSEDEPMSPDSAYCDGSHRRSHGHVRFDSMGDDGNNSFDGAISDSDMARLRMISEGSSNNSFDGGISDNDMRRLRMISECSDLSITEASDGEDDIISPEEEAKIFQNIGLKVHRASCVADEINLRKQQNIRTPGDSVLGKVHHEVAKYHEVGRFSKTDIDWDAAIFHETIAADLGVMEAIITIAKIYMGCQPDILVNCKVPDSPDNLDKGVEYMDIAADLGDRAAIIFMADAFESGNNLGSKKQRSYRLACGLYEKSLKTNISDEDGGFDACMAHPAYEIKAKMAQMYLEGGYGLEKDPSWAGDLYNEAAEEASAAMKGRLSMKYYEKAEEAYGEVEE